MKFEVPQFIEIEDKIFGPFTWRQFLYLAGGGGVAVVLLVTTPFIVFVFIGLPLGALAVALAFFPVNNRPFSHFLEGAYNYMVRQKLYLWQQKREIVHKTFIPMTIDNPMNDAKSTNLPSRNISSLARQLELKALQKK